MEELDKHISLSAIYNNPTFSEFGRPCDTHLKTDDGTEFKVYSKLLSNRSDFFRTLFSYDEAVGQSVVIHGIDSNILEKVIVYLYTRYISLNTRNMLHLLVASDFLLVDSLLLKCRRFVSQNINLENCVKIFLIAYRIKESDLENKCCKFILLCCEKASKLCKNKPYNILNSVKYFLSNESITVTEEKVIWSYIEGWIKKDSSSNKYTSLYEVYNNPSFPEFLRPCDTYLKTDDGTEFEVYGKLLANRSEFFKNIFSFDKACGPSVVINGIKSDILEKVLIYLYTRHASLKTENMLDLLVASELLLIEPLLLECRRFILKNINQANCVNILLTAQRMKELEIEDKCLRCIQISFEKAVKQSRNKAYNMPYDSVKYLLSNGCLNVSDEKAIWSYIEGWVKKDKSNRLSVVPELLRYLCVNDIDDKLASLIITSPIIRQNELYKDLGDPQVTLHPLSNKQKAEKIIAYRNKIPFSPISRLPKSVYFVTKGSLQNDVVEMFMTYDDRLDFWRKLGQASFKLHTLLRVGHRVYIFKQCRHVPNYIDEACVYDLFANKVLPMATSNNPPFLLVSEASGHVYGFQIANAQVTLQRYVDATDEWTSLTPIPDPLMIPSAAVGPNGLIYIVGDIPAMQVYDPSSDTWKVVEPPKEERLKSEAVVYQDKIFLLGYQDSLKDIEVYDPIKDEWLNYPEVPFGSDVTDLGLKVVMGRLYVFSRSPPYSVAYWDGFGGWTLADDQSHLQHMFLYSFCHIEEGDIVGRITKINRSVDTSKWIESGLGEEMLLKF